MEKTTHLTLGGQTLEITPGEPDCQIVRYHTIAVRAPGAVREYLLAAIPANVSPPSVEPVSLGGTPTCLFKHDGMDQFEYLVDRVVIPSTGITLAHAATDLAVKLSFTDEGETFSNSAVLDEALVVRA